MITRKCWDLTCKLLGWGMVDTHVGHTGDVHPLYCSEQHHIDPTNELYRHHARRLYGMDDVTIDHNAVVCEANDGAWVQAWVYVTREDIKP